jgi:predicted nucleic acid-binding Zn ribbon protein
MTDVEPGIRHCELCGDPFMPDQATQIYCSDKHRRTAEKRRQRLRKRMARHGGKLVSGVQTHASADDDLMSLHARTTRRSSAPPPPCQATRTTTTTSRTPACTT